MEREEGVGKDEGDGEQGWVGRVEPGLPEGGTARPGRVLVGEDVTTVGSDQNSNQDLDDRHQHLRLLEPLCLDHPTSGGGLVAWRAPARHSQRSQEAGAAAEV